jgi:YfiH family protein
MQHPFRLLTQYTDRLDVQLFTKNDKLITDQSVAQSCGSTDYAALDQVHGNRVINVSEHIYRTEKADGLITDQTNLALMIRIADCQPLIIYAPDANVVGLLHAGWKGLVAGAIPSMMNALQETFHVEPKECLVGIGPCLCTGCAEFSNPLLELPGIPQDLIDGNTADLRTWADRQLLKARILPEHIERMEECTRCHPEKYWTYRGGDREAVKNGRTNVLACVLKN